MSPVSGNFIEGGQFAAFSSEDFFSGLDQDKRVLLGVVLNEVAID
jgi:hypothetical protein